MLLIPAIDIKDGRCVRLRQGRMDEVTVFDDDPRAAARRWVDEGARRLHLVDLDGAVAGAPMNDGLVREVAAMFPEIEVQVGGGIRDEATVAAYLEAGVRYAILGTGAVTTPGFVASACAAFPQRVIVGIDARDGRVAVDGWEKSTGEDAVELARRVAADGAAAIIHTDIGRDGMMSGANVAATRELAQAIDIPVFVSGGLRDLEDLHAFEDAAGTGVAGAIVGRAIYEGTLDFAAGAARLQALNGERAPSRAG